MYASRNLPEVVRFSQEATEYAVKSALKLVEIEYPKRHDPSEALREGKSRFPKWFRVSIESTARLARDLARNRELAVYGDERLAKTPEEIFSDSSRVAAWLSDARRVVGNSQRLYKEVVRSKATRPALNGKLRRARPR